MEDGGDDDEVGLEADITPDEVEVVGVLRRN